MCVAASTHPRRACAAYGPSPPPQRTPLACPRAVKQNDSPPGRLCDGTQGVCGRGAHVRAPLRLGQQPRGLGAVGLGRRHRCAHAQRAGMLPCQRGTSPPAQYASAAAAAAPGGAPHLATQLARMHVASHVMPYQSGVVLGCVHASQPSTCPAWVPPGVVLGAVVGHTSQTPSSSLNTCLAPSAVPPPARTHTLLRSSCQPRSVSSSLALPARPNGVCR